MEGLFGTLGFFKSTGLKKKKDEKMNMNVCIFLQRSSSPETVLITAAQHETPDFLQLCTT